MWNFLAALVKNFLLLRDLFGYVIPGAVLVAFAVYAENPNLSHLPLSDESIWVRAIFAITGSYVVGHVLAAIGYTLYELYDRLRPTSKTPRLEDVPLYWYYRYVYPSMFIEVDRRDTLTILRVALGVALVIAGCFLVADYPAIAMPTVVRPAVLVIGLFMLVNGYGSRRAVVKYGHLVVEAAKTAEAKGIPIFRWSDGDGSGGSASGGTEPNPESPTGSHGVPAAGTTARALKSSASKRPSSGNDGCEPAAAGRLAHHKRDLAELMNGAHGIIDSGVTDLATNPRHLTGFGRDPRHR